MKTGSVHRAMACAGAVVGAGFASGREITAFFSRYGRNSWWLIALAVWAMARMCLWYMASSHKTGAAAQVCMMALLGIAGGAMLSAGGQMIALLWNRERAYSIAIAGTLLMAWMAGRCRMGVFSWAGSALSCLLLCAVCAVMIAVPAGKRAVLLHEPQGVPALAGAAMKATGYAAMNMTLALDMVKRCAADETAANRRTACAFAAVMAVLLCVSNALYLRFPQLFEEPFPIVRLLSAFGRKGFVLSVILLYLAIFTTLVSVVSGLESIISRHTDRRSLQVLVSLGLPLLFSCAGFSGIVDGLYAPAGWLCLALIPGMSTKNKRLRTQEILDKQAWIQ